MERTMTGDIGGRLRRARELKGLSLADAARHTKLSINILQAIERNDFASLPGGMFRKAYVRTLATEVGLDPNEIAAEYCAQVEPVVDTAAAPDPDTALEEKLVEQLTPRPHRSLLTFAAVAAPAIAWFMLQPGPVGANVPLDSEMTEPAAIMSPFASIAFTAGPHRVVSTPPANAVGETAPLRIDMTATDSCWVAAETDGERVMYRLVEPGERVLLEAQHRIALRLGNAASMRVSINGGASRSLGGDGQIVDLDITPGNVESFLGKANTTLQLN